MTSPTSYGGYLLLSLRRSLVVVAVVAAGLLLYANSNGEAVQWNLVLYVALGMAVSSLVNSRIDMKKDEKERLKADSKKPNARR